MFLGFLVKVQKFEPEWLNQVSAYFFKWQVLYFIFNTFVKEILKTCFHCVDNCRPYYSTGSERVWTLREATVCFYPCLKSSTALDELVFCGFKKHISTSPAPMLPLSPAKSQIWNLVCVISDLAGAQLGSASLKCYWFAPCALFYYGTFCADSVFSDVLPLYVWQQGW